MPINYRETTVIIDGVTSAEYDRVYPYYAVRCDSGEVYASAVKPGCPVGEDGVVSLREGDSIVICNAQIDNRFLYLNGSGSALVIGQYGAVNPFDSAAGGTGGSDVQSSDINGNILVNGVQIKVYDDSELKVTDIDYDQTANKLTLTKKDALEELTPLGSGGEINGTLKNNANVSYVSGKSDSAKYTFPLRGTNLDGSVFFNIATSHTESLNGLLIQINSPDGKTMAYFNIYADNSGSAFINTNCTLPSAAETAVTEEPA